MLENTLKTLFWENVPYNSIEYTFSPQSFFRLLHLDSKSSLEKIKSDLSRVLAPNFQNIEIVQMDVEDLFKDTPVINLIPVINSAHFKFVHTSDVARLAVVYKFGGIYSDADIILRRKPDFGAKFYTQSGASSLLINAAFASPKHDHVIYQTLVSLNSTYSPKGYTVMYEHEKVTKRHCISSCGTKKEFNQNKTSFMCCDLKIVGKFSKVYKLHLKFIEQ